MLILASPLRCSFESLVRAGKQLLQGFLYEFCLYQRSKETVNLDFLFELESICCQGFNGYFLIFGLAFGHGDPGRGFRDGGIGILCSQKNGGSAPRI